MTDDDHFSRYETPGDARDLDSLARLREDVRPPDAAVLTAARARLLDQDVVPAVLALRPRRSPVRRRVLVGLTAAAAVAAVAAGSFVLTQDGPDRNPQAQQVPSVSSTPPSPGAPASELLQLAAKHTLLTGDPKVAADQYTFVRTHAWFVANIGGPGETPADSTRPEDREVSYLSEDRYEIWVPGRSSGTWYWRYTRPLQTRFFSAEDKAIAYRAVGADGFRTQVERYTGKDGQMSGGDRVPVTWDIPTPAFLAALPRDPDALLAKLFDDPNKPDSDPANRFDNAFLHIGQVLSSGLVPADLRSALYTVAATKIPGISVTERTANLDGRTGVSVGRVQSGPGEGDSKVRQDIIFDTAGGRYIGNREVTIGKNTLFHVPSGTTIESTAVTVSVADKPGFTGTR